MVETELLLLPVSYFPAASEAFMAVKVKIQISAASV